MLQQITLSIQKLAHEFLIPILCSLLIHALILVTLAHYISNGSNKQTQGKQTLQVNLEPKPNGLASSPALPEKANQPTSKLFHRDSDSNLPIPKMEESHPILDVPEPLYYTIKELEHAPVILKNVDNDPPELLQFIQGGELTIQIWIDENGDVVNTEIVKSNLPEEFNKSAITNFSAAKFSPGIKNNIPVKTVAKITVRYAPKERNKD